MDSISFPKIMTIALDKDGGTVILKREFVSSLEYTLELSKRIWLESDMEIMEVKLDECEIENPDSFFFIFFSLAKSYTKIAAIDLDFSSIGDMGIIGLCSVLSNPIFDTLKKISLRRNNITATGLKHLLQCLLSNKQHLQIESIYLSQNQLRDDGAILLAEYIPSFEKLKTLHLSYNGIGLDGVARIAPYFFSGKCSIESFSFMSNPYGLQGLKIILNSLTSSRKLKSLIIGNTPPFIFQDTQDDSFSDLISTYLASNPLLQQIVIFGLEGSQIKSCLEKGMENNTLLESLTIPSTISPIPHKSIPFLQLMKLDNALEYIKITDGIKFIETVYPGKSIEAAIRNQQIADLIKVKRLLPLLTHRLPNDYGPQY